MRIVELPGSNASLNIRETPKELPINRYADFQKYLIQQAGIGSEMADVNSHFERLHRFLSNEMIEEARREAYNLHMNLHLMLNKIDIESLAFACCVDSIKHQSASKKPEDAYLEKITDYSEAGLIILCKRMGELGLTKAMVSEIVSEIKKKSIEV